MLHDRRVAVVRERPSYSRSAPFHPSERFPEWPDLPTSTEDNPAYRGVRRVLDLLEFDSAHLGTPNWNPLGDLIRPGDKVILKPNLVSHCNIGAETYGLTDTDSLVTHASIIRAVLDYVGKALRGAGSVTVGDCPVQGADWEALLDLLELPAIEAYFRQQFPGVSFEAHDYRLSRARVRDGRVVERMADERDRGRYLEVDLDGESLLEPLMEGSYTFGVAQYSRERMRRAHSPGTNLYLFPMDILEADVVINLPKMKTHMKAGMTGALKNLVGINGHKDYLPHFRFGSPRDGGDEYPDGDWLWNLMWFFSHLEWEKDRGLRKELYSLLARACAFVLPWISGLPRNAGIVGGGSWYGNDTLWRTILDINRGFFYFDREVGRMRPQPSHERRYLALLDGLIVGEKESPLSPSPLAGGYLLGARNPAALDAVEAALLGLDVSKVRQVMEAFKPMRFPLVCFRPEDIQIRSDLQVSSVADVVKSRLPLNCELSKGYKGHLERRAEPIYGSSVAPPW